MSRKYFSIRHVETLALLPQVLTPGTAYFVDDEKIIVVDYGDGRGPITYGGSYPAITIPPTIGNGFLQEQINTLSGGVLVLEKAYWDESEHIRQELSHITNQLTTATENLIQQSAANAEGILRLAGIINDQANRTNAALSILTKAITDIYNYMTSQGAVIPSPSSGDNDPLDNEILETDSGSWVIQQTYNADGSMSFELQAVELTINTLKAGDKLTYGGEEWTVESIENADGTITLSLRQ